MRKSLFLVTVAAMLLTFGGATSFANDSLIAPTPAASDLTVEVELAGSMPSAPGDNIASPQPYGPDELFLISHVPTGDLPGPR